MINFKSVVKYNVLEDLYLFRLLLESNTMRISTINQLNKLLFTDLDEELDTDLDDELDEAIST